jgi:hypothetical protein
MAWLAVFDRVPNPDHWPVDPGTCKASSSCPSTTARHRPTTHGSDLRGRRQPRDQEAHDGLKR